jgi:hypothetical protein
VVYFDLDETLIHQTVFPSEMIQEEPAAQVRDYTVWVRPGAPEALQRLLEASYEVHVMTSGQEKHQRRVVHKVFPGFPGVVYSSRPGSKKKPEAGRPWVLIDDLSWDTVGVQEKAAILGAEQGRLIQIAPYSPVRFSRLADERGIPQREPEDGSVIMAAVDEITKERVNAQ